MSTDPRYRDETNLPPVPKEAYEPIEEDEGPDDFAEIFVANLNQNALEHEEYEKKQQKR
jgi:hypothetical protein